MATRQLTVAASKGDSANKKELTPEQKEKRKKIKCFKCQRMGRYASECTRNSASKHNKSEENNMTTSTQQGMFIPTMCVEISYNEEVNLARDVRNRWLLDSGSTVHIAQTSEWNGHGREWNWDRINCLWYRDPDRRPLWTKENLWNWPMCFMHWSSSRTSSVSQEWLTRVIKWSSRTIAWRYETRAAFWPAKETKLENLEQCID